MITQTLAGTVPSAGGNGASPATAGPSWGYRPHLDGLRSVAGVPGGPLVWRTEGHITGAYAERIAPESWALLVAEGVIDP